MNENVVEIALRANTANLIAGLKEGAGATGTAAASMRQEMASLGSGAAAAHAPLTGLTGALKEWRTHVRTEARYTNFMAAQVAGLGFASKSAAAEVTGLVSAFAFGGGIGLAVETVKLAAHVFHDMEEAEKAANEELKKLNDELIAGTDKVKKWAEQTLLAMQGASKAQLQANLEIKPLLEERAELEKKINDAALKIVETREKGNGQVIEASSALAAIDEAELARMRVRLDLLNKMIPARQLALAPVAQEQARQDVAKELEDDAKLYAQKEKLRRDHLMRVSKAEFDAMKALQKMGDEQDKYQRDRVAEQEKREDDLADLRERRIKERFAELKKQVHEAIAEGTTFGNAFGTAFAGIAAGTMSVTKAFSTMAQAIVRVIFDQVRKAIEAYALQAAAAAAAANAGIPFVGVFAAAAAAAAMEALVMGLLGSLPSAAVGMPRVPADMPVYVHKNEAILTSGQADDWRSGKGGGGSVVHNHYWQAIDGASVERFVNGPDFERAFSKAKHFGRIK